jgi:hypothetical protein
LSPRCPERAEFMAEIHYERNGRPTLTNKPACREHAKKFAAKWKVPFPVLDARGMCQIGSEPLA